MKYTAFWSCSPECYALALDKYIEPKYRFTANFTVSDQIKEIAREYRYEYPEEYQPLVQNAVSRALDAWVVERDWQIKKAAEHFGDEIVSQYHKWQVEDASREAKELSDSVRLPITADRLALQTQGEPVQPLPDAKFFEHTHILGPSGSGKTTLLQNLVLDWLGREDPPALVILDPKGEMIQRISKLGVFNPDTGRLRDRLVIIDPKYKPALNMFHPAQRWNKMYSDEVRQQLEQQAISTFTYVFSTSGSPLTDKQKVPFGFAALLLFEMNNTPNSSADLLTLLDLMDDQLDTRGTPREKFANSPFRPFMSRLDPITQRFFQNDFYGSNYSDTRQQIKARLNTILRRAEIRNIFVQPNRELDIFDCFQRKKIVLVNTGLPVYGSESSQLIGQFIITLALNAAFERYAIPRSQWNPAYLIVDEFQEFADEELTPKLLRLAREYNLEMALAHQNMYCPELNDNIRNAISTNTSIKYAASPEAMDLNYVAKDLRCDPSFLRQQKVHDGKAHFACYVRGMTQHPMQIELDVLRMAIQQRMTNEQYQRLIQTNTSQLAGKPRAPTIDTAPRPEPQPRPQSTSGQPDSDKLW